LVLAVVQIQLEAIPYLEILPHRGVVAVALAVQAQV
jgi:hypothetical protein